jgi:predicted nucleic acid-binding protein
MRVFLDANVLFSAAKSDGAVRELLTRVRAAGHYLCADAYVVAEARRNLELKTSASVAALETLLSHVEITPFHATELPSDVAARLPDKDRPVLAAAMAQRCDALVTGDRKHFGALYGTIVGGVLIHSPRSLAEALLR